nr:hypothetical protein Iba_scaffold5113CG0020 [Ipomoea batatas]
MIHLPFLPLRFAFLALSLVSLPLVSSQRRQHCRKSAGDELRLACFERQHRRIIVGGGGLVNSRRGRSTDGWPSELAVVPAPLTVAVSLPRST